MTNPEASPDGTGTQTDEVRQALATLLSGATAYASDPIAEAHSVLSAEIERLTRRVEEIQAERDDCADDIIDLNQRYHETNAALTRARQSLASAAPDERVLAERELAQAAFRFVAWAMREGPWESSELEPGDIQDKAQALGLIVEIQYDPAKHGENFDGSVPGDQWFELAPTILEATRTPDQDTAP